MKVLHLTSGRLSGGVDTMLITLAGERNRCPAMEPAFAVCFDQGWLAQQLRGIGVPVHSLGPLRVRRPWQILRARARLQHLLAAQRFDVVVSHSSWIHALLGGVARQCGLPLAFWMHNKASREGMNFIERCAGRLRPDLAVCNSVFTAATLPVLFGRFPPASKVIHCPVAAPKRSARPSEHRAMLRRKLNTGENDVVIIQVGWMEPCKGYHLHLAALRRLREVPGWACWMVGGAETAPQRKYLAEMQAIAVESGLGQRVQFLGQRRDVDALLAAADVFCQPNVDPEAFGIVFVEALYAGLPVVSVRHGGVREIVDKDCGCLVPPGDVEALAQTLRMLIEHSTWRAQMATAAPYRAAQVSSPDRILAEMHDAFKPIVAGAPISTTTSQAR